MKRRCYHTPSTIPDCVRPEVVRAWNALWRRMRKFPQQERKSEFRFGTRLKVGAVDFKIRWIESRRDPPPCCSSHDMWVWALSLGEHERTVPGSCAFGYGKPYTYLDELQSALDELTVASVMTG